LKGPGVVQGLAQPGLLGQPTQAVAAPAVAKVSMTR
jgi:hypothetical protein